MPITPPIQPITETDTALKLLLEQVELPAVLPALAHTLGELSLVPPDLRLPEDAMFVGPQAGWTDEQQARVRSLALAALGRFRDAGCPPSAPLGDDARTALLRWTTGSELPGSYLPMLTEELNAADADLRAPQWSATTLAPDRTLTVAIIGAGMSGILAAHRLVQAGLEVVLFERNAGIGGTWFSNTYPGCRVDVSNHAYCYSFMQKSDWPNYHSSQEELLAYFNACADEFDVRDRIRFDTTVASLRYDDDTQRWSALLETPAGAEVFEADIVISAVGQLNQPSFPDIDGIDDFEGISFHSAEWDHTVDLTGKRVGVIGTGCSAMQLIPHVADDASHLTVFQRTPAWLFVRPEYHLPCPDSLLWFMQHLPNFANWYRLRMFWQSHIGMLPRLEVDPDWPEPIEHSVSAASAALRKTLEGYLRHQFADQPDLIEKIIPPYPVGAKRFVMDNGIWARTLARDDVRLETEPIGAIHPTGITTEDGARHELDVIIYGTGFKASEFLMPMKVTGSKGRDLHETWDGDARAYLGVATPGFPNLFYTYGPNTNIVINGSIIYFSECEVRYITDCVRELLESGHRAMDVRAGVHDEYNERIDAGNARMAWGASSVSSWYKAPSGRVAQNWPFSMLEYWTQTQAVDPADYTFT